MQMRAVLVKDGKGPVENLYIGETTKPVPRPGEVVVKVNMLLHLIIQIVSHFRICAQIKAFGLNRMDISQREGFYPPPAGSSSILGVEFSGEVSEVGLDVSEWKVKDEVLGLAGGVSSSHTHELRIVSNPT